MKRMILLLITFVGFLLLLLFVDQQHIAAWLQGSPSLEYLGEGGSYKIEPGRHFIVKHNNPFGFVNQPGPEYHAASNERVWAGDFSAPVPIYRSWTDYGHVPENCKISYTAIDDDPDDRINVFYVGDEAVHDMPQGMVTGGHFTTPKAGSLRLFAADSIGIWLNKCQVQEASPTPPHTPTAQPTEEPTASPTPLLTSTPGPSPTPSTTPVASSTPAAPEITATPGQPPTRVPVTITPTATKKPRLPACLRINFEVSGGEAREGIYEIREVGGRLLYTWFAQAGWRDSGWIYGIDISFEDVYIEVFYVQDDAPPVNMVIVNAAPGTSYGWLSRGICHALEVGWPDETITPAPTPDAFDGFNDEFDLELLDLQHFIWPDIQPTPSSTPARSLRG